MNYFSGSRFRRVPAVKALVLAAAILTGCGAPTAETAAQTSTDYELSYVLSPNPRAQSVDVEMTVAQPRHLLREMSFDGARLSDIAGDGELRIDDQDGRVTWSVPESGGTLRWRVDILNARNAGGYDAWLDASFGLFRAEDAIPRARTRALSSAVSQTRIAFELPDNWSVVTEYRRNRDGGSYVRSDERRFVQPTGWILMGELGVRRDEIAGVRVAIAAPVGHGARRIDMLALLNWGLPELLRVVPAPPDRITVITAADPMWRGGLSAPGSIYIHSDRPLISENGTSTLLHEAMHVLMSVRAEPDHDWLLEGFAEYYSLEALRRSGTISAERYAASIDSLTEWAESAPGLCGGQSTGPQTALAVVTLAALDREISDATAGDSNLDDVLIDLLETNSPISLEMLTASVARLIGENPDVLHIDRLPGCRTIASGANSTR